MRNIAIYGAGGFGREVRMLIKQINKSNLEFDFIGYFDDNNEKKGKNFLEIEEIALKTKI